MYVVKLMFICLSVMALSVCATVTAVALFGAHISAQHNGKH
jgi:hypothetical protein